MTTMIDRFDMFPQGGARATFRGDAAAALVSDLKRAAFLATGALIGVDSDKVGRPLTFCGFTVGPVLTDGQRWTETGEVMKQGVTDIQVLCTTGTPAYGKPTAEYISMEITGWFWRREIEALALGAEEVPTTATMHQPVQLQLAGIEFLEKRLKELGVTLTLVDGKLVPSEAGKIPPDVGKMIRFLKPRMVMSREMDSFMAALREHDGPILGRTMIESGLGTRLWDHLALADGAYTACNIENFHSGLSHARNALAAAKRILNQESPTP
jgi:hypothetical protein